MKRILLTILFFAGLAILETTVFSYLNLFGAAPNLLFLAVITANIFEPAKEKAGICGAATAGFLWDIFSGKFIGFHLLILTATAVFIKTVVKRYIRIPDYLFSGKRHG